jgi:predicted aldo/keto reductase-like oxidoreductase
MPEMNARQTALFSLGLGFLVLGCQARDEAKCNQGFDVARQAIKSNDFALARQWREYAYKRCDATGQDQAGLPPVLERAHAQGVGVVAMKTLMGARANDMRPYERDGGTFSQAAFRWVLSNPNVDALVVSMNDREMIDEYLGASGSARLSRADLELLGRYAAKNGSSYCQHGCSLCDSACPAQVDISGVLRTRMYDVDYGDREFARAEYANLDHPASACLSCDGTPCLSACPNDIEIPKLTRQAARTLG